MEPAVVLQRLALALACGLVVGFERQWHMKQAGLRTNALVALGAAGFVAFGVLHGAGDPTRVAAAVASGIGFLGAGVILRDGINVHGLNTAATLWCSAMVGVLSGAGYPLWAVEATAMIVATNWVLRPLLRRMNRRVLDVGDMPTRYVLAATVPAEGETASRGAMLDLLRGAGLDLRRLDSAALPERRAVRVSAHVTAGQRDDGRVEELAATLAARPGFTDLAWQVEAVAPDA